MSSEPPAQSRPPATPDAPPEATFDWQHSGFEAFLERHFKKILLVLAVLALAVAIWLVWRQQAQEARRAQAAAFTSAETIEEYQKVIAQHPGTTAAGSAQLMIANLAQEPADAVDALETFLSTYPNHPLRDHAAFRSAVLTASKIDPEKGLQKLEEFIASYPNSELRPLARIRRGDVLFGLGRAEEARQAYQELLDDTSFAGHSLYRDAESRLQQAKLKAPQEVEFVPEPESPPSPTPDVPEFNIDSLLQPTPSMPAPNPLEGEAPASAPDPAAQPAAPEATSAGAGEGAAPAAPAAESGDAVPAEEQPETADPAAEPASPPPAGR